MASPRCDTWTQKSQPLQPFGLVFVYWTSWKKIATVLKVFYVDWRVRFSSTNKKNKKKHCPGFHRMFHLNILLYNDAPETDCNNHIQFFKILVAFWHWLGVEHVTRTARGGMGPTWCRLKLPLANFMNRDDKLGVYKYMYVYVCCVKNICMHK